ncbi:3D domain-containing protein [Clostridium botulinum]|nr:3D/G5 domain-containing protein [Clostridium botulinum CFSAN002367]MCS4438443.1 3D domain-containing protein [Clostridium botulinum]MCS4447989.1 3D domain-containing protein [Clostridium botulinum]
MDYETVVKEDDSLEKGDKKVIREGQNGEKEVTTKVVFEDGKEKVRKVVSESIKKQPVSKVVAMGTKVTTVNALSRGGSVTGTPGGRSLRMRATAYTSSYEDTGKSPGSPDFGVTATGTTARRNSGGYSSIAVDPRVIPLGTKLFVEGYGYAIAEDTGGAIKGNVIDLYFDSNVEVSNWGSRWVNVYILD